MNTYAYRIYRNTPNNPIIGGTVSSQNMEQATKEIIKQNKIMVVHDTAYNVTRHYFMFRNSSVGILIYLNPEEF